MATGVVYGPGNIAADTSRKRSPSIWSDCPIQAIREGQVDGYYFEDDFLSIPKTPPTTEGNFGQYKAFTSTGGIIQDAVAPGGVVAIGSDGDNEGAVIGPGIFPFFLNTSAKRFWFEARIGFVKVADSTTAGMCDAFVGLADSTAFTATSPIGATSSGTGSGLSVMADVNLVGFLRSAGLTAGQGASLSTIYKANGVTAVAVGSLTYTSLAASVSAVGGLGATTPPAAMTNMVKVGMRYDPVDNYLRFYFNGVEDANKKLLTGPLGTDFPDDVYLGLVLGQINNGANANSIASGVYIDAWAAAQLY